MRVTSIKRKNRTWAAAGVAAALALASSSASAAPAAPVFTDPVAGGVVGTSMVTVRGTAGGDVVVVRVFEGGTPLGDTGPSGGYWAITLPFSDGPHSLTVRGRDAGGTWSPHSPARAFTVDTVAPAKPVITSPTTGAAITFANPPIEGTAEPGSTVTVTADTGATLTATASGTGAWTATRTWSETSHTITAVARDAAGHASVASNPVTFRIDTRAPAPPFIATPGQGQRLRSTSVTVTGSAEPGATVSLHEGATLATTVATNAGTWSITRTFTEGTHAISARAVDAAGHTSAQSAATTFTVDVTAPAAPSILSPPEGSWQRANVAITGSAEPLATVFLLQGGGVYLTTQADGAGAWRFDLNLWNGPHAFSARARDVAGNDGPASALRSFTVDSEVPTVSIDTADGTIFMPSQAPIIRGAARDNAGVAGIELQYWDVLGRVTIRAASCNGCPGGTDVTWSSYWAPPTGRWILKAYAIDRAGNRSFLDEIAFTKI